MDTPSTAVQIIVSVIPIVGIVCGFILLLVYIALNHRQRIIMIEKGIIRKEFDYDALNLFSGLILTGIGITLLVFFIIKEGLSYAVLSGLIPLSIGLSMLIFFAIRIKMIKSRDEG